jgi:hypothetical protein
MLRNWKSKASSILWEDMIQPATPEKGSSFSVEETRTEYRAYDKEKCIEDMIYSAKSK